MNNHQEHQFVDLDLPSGTLWATCNIGASKPVEYGEYFAWGETMAKSTYNWSTYQYANEHQQLTKYCNKCDFGNRCFADNLTTLQIDDDPATVNWGSDWCTPTLAQWEELLNNTTAKWMTQNGVKGRLFTSKKNGQTLFLPAAGFRSGDELDCVGLDCAYWSSSLDMRGPSHAWTYLMSAVREAKDINLDKYLIGSNSRDYGQSIRAVRSSR